MNLHAWHIPLEGSTRLAVLFHGYGGAKSALLAEARLFRELGFSTLLVDFRGSGQSSESIATLEETRPGDLAFFSGAGNHVGIIQGSGKIIHASGSVRVDRLDETGIWNLQTRENTHQTTAFRRIL